MDINGLRSLNLVGTVLFGIFGIGIPVVYGFFFGFIAWLDPAGGFFIICLTVIIIWIAIFAYLTSVLYQNTVRGLDRGEFQKAKQWTLYGAIIGFIFAGGVITLVIFLISYISFDDAVWPKPFYPPPGYYPYPPPYQYPPTYPPYQYPRQPPPPQYRAQRPPPPGYQARRPPPPQYQVKRKPQYKLKKEEKY